jgi:tetratricopeptide (TPR) repeat protein
MIPVPSVVYVFIVYFILFVVPLALSVKASSPVGTMLWLIVTAASIVLYSLTHHYTKSKGLTLNYGLLEICESKESGCANLTLVYMVPLLIVAYFLAVVATFGGLIKGRRFSQERWIAIVARLGQGIQYGPIVGEISVELEKAPNRADLLLRRAVEYERCGQAELAVADYDKVLSLQPRNADVLFRKGRLCEELGKTREAITVYRQFLHCASGEDQERRALVKEWLSDLGEPGN